MCTVALILDVGCCLVCDDKSGIYHMQYYCTCENVGMLVLANYKFNIIFCGGRVTFAL